MDTRTSKPAAPRQANHRQPTTTPTPFHAQCPKAVTTQKHLSPQHTSRSASTNTHYNRPSRPFQAPHRLTSQHHRRRRRRHQPGAELPGGSKTPTLPAVAQTPPPPAPQRTAGSLHPGPGGPTAHPTGNAVDSARPVDAEVGRLHAQQVRGDGGGWHWAGGALHRAEGSCRPTGAGGGSRLLLWSGALLWRALAVFRFIVVSWGRGCASGEAGGGGGGKATNEWQMRRRECW